MNPGISGQSAQDLQAAQLKEGRVDVQGLIDDAPLGFYQVFLCASLFLIMLMDGFDTQLIPIAGPQLYKDLNINFGLLGALFAAGNLGAAVAGFAVALFTNKWGRRRLLIWAMALSTLLTFGFLLADTYLELLVLRIASGLLLGGAAGVVAAYAAELMPKRVVIRSIVIINTGFALGVALSGFVGAWMLPRYGWHSLFVVGGVGSLLATLLLAMMPESVRFLVIKGGNDDKARHTLEKLAGTRIHPTLPLHLKEEQKPGYSFKHIFANGRMAPALMLWGIAFLLTAELLVLAQWLPTLISQATNDISIASASVGWLKIGAILGALLCAYAVDGRRNPYIILGAVLGLGAVACFQMSVVRIDSFAFMVAVFLTGALLTGPQYLLPALLARLFPTYVRMSGVGINIGVARGGAMFGPLIIGFLKDTGWSSSLIFEALSAMTLISASIFLALAWHYRRSEPELEEAHAA